jgi:hypothetical protein
MRMERRYSLDDIDDDEEWIAAKLQEARAECARCRGREMGDCSDQCCYFRPTASAAELEELQRRRATWTPRCRRSRGWLGPRARDPDTSDPP